MTNHERKTLTMQQRQERRQQAKSKRQSDSQLRKRETPKAAGAPSEAMPRILLNKIRIDGGTQMRAGLNDQIVQEYADVLYAQESALAWPFPPLTVYYDGETYWLADGFHRLMAFCKSLRVSPSNPDLGYELPATVLPGTRRDAILHAAGANVTHGLRRTNADKRRAVETLLRDEEWQQWSDREVARRCAVDHELVGRIRAQGSAELSGGIRQIEARSQPEQAPQELAPFVSPHPEGTRPGGLATNLIKANTQRKVTRKGTTYVQDTANIGRKVPATPEAEPEIETLPIESKRLSDAGFSLQRYGDKWRYAWQRADTTSYSALMTHRADVFDAAFAALAGGETPEIAPGRAPAPPLGAGVLEEEAQAIAQVEAEHAEEQRLRAAMNFARDEGLTFAEWLALMPADLGLREQLAILTLAKATALHALGDHPKLYNAVYGALPTWSQLITTIEKELKK